MARYKITKDSNEIHVFGYDQSFSQDDIKSLWEDHNILYLKGGIMAVWVEKRRNTSPLVHLMGEDDGHIFWSKDTDVCFDAGWLDNYIKTLTKVKDLLKEGSLWKSN